MPKLFCLWIFWIQTLVFFSSPALAKPSSWEILAHELAPHFKPYVKTFTRPIFLFHGTDTSEAALSYLNSQVAKAFESHTDSDDNAGPGLYLGITPELSATFGDRIMVLEAEPGKFRFLDATRSGFQFYYSGREIPLALLRAGIKLGCGFWNSGFFHQKCAKLRAALFKELGINGIFYIYRHKPTTHPEEKNHHIQGSFVLTSLQGIKIKPDLRGENLPLSLEGYAKAEAFPSVEAMQTRYYLGLNPDHRWEQHLSSGYSENKIDKIQKEFAQVQLIYPLDDYFDTNPNLFRVFERRDTILRKIRLSWDAVNEEWRNFIDHSMKGLDFDDAFDSEKSRFTTYPAKEIPHLPNVISVQKGFNLASIGFPGDAPQVFPPGKFNERCQRTLMNRIFELESSSGVSEIEKNISAALKAVLSGENQFQEAIRQIPPKNPARDEYVLSFAAAPCLISASFLESSYGSPDVTATAYHIYLRPSDPDLRKQRLLEIIQDLKTRVNSPDTPNIELLQAIQEIALLDPLKTSTDSVRWTQKLTHYLFESRSPSRHSPFQLKMPNGVYTASGLRIYSRYQGREDATDELLSVLWRIFSVNHSL